MAIRGLCTPNRAAPSRAAHQRKPSAKWYVNKQLENSKKSKLHDGDRSRYLVWGRNGGWEQARRNFWIINNLVFFSGCVSMELPTLWNLLSCRFLLFGSLPCICTTMKRLFKKKQILKNSYDSMVELCMNYKSGRHFQKGNWCVHDFKGASTGLGLIAATEKGR